MNAVDSLDDRSFPSPNLGGSVFWDGLSRTIKQGNHWMVNLILQVLDGNMLIERGQNVSRFVRCYFWVCLKIGDISPILGYLNRDKRHNLLECGATLFPHPCLAATEAGTSPVEVGLWMVCFMKAGRIPVFPIDFRLLLGEKNDITACSNRSESEQHNQHEWATAPDMMGLGFPGSLRGPMAYFIATRWYPSHQIAAMKLPPRVLSMA